MQSFQNGIDSNQMVALTQGLPSKSAKIRTLGRAGYSRRQIADFMGTSYQFVRNVLVDAERAAVEKMPDAERLETPKSPQNAVRLQVGPNGDVTIPAHLLGAVGSGPGKYLLARFDDDEIKLVTPEATARKIQAAVRKFVPEGVSLVDELLKERRREASNEQGNA